MKTLIGIAANMIVEQSFHLDQNVVGSHYVESVVRGGGLPLLIPFTRSQADLAAYVRLCDGFLFCGGADINPLLFGENPHPSLGSGNLDLDRFHLSLMKKILTVQKPVLGICRGIQVLNVACGGTVYQDLSLMEGTPMKHMQSEAKRYFVTHEVKFTDNSVMQDLFGSSLFTNSYHHQSVNSLGRNLIATGFSDDGIIESIEHTENPFQIGVQWHPENFIEISDVMLPLFQRLVEQAKRNQSTD
ncbi:gamma-glutamyl-gamma-aminobutyrate hydrolase family protein [Konateibacter massiliensis]|uniref:gamma-glutamyl-gamma-aminobutyrate hydrolase family protein n=1 Tax=Konateibacter massiliensis TaxID=2002841 RepID=UPI000C15920E|nr:gamma-glutamyl-gamma-aminobutyrate hydrolase family protein [Konateibacter massiliensis]